MRAPGLIIDFGLADHAAVHIDPQELEDVIETHGTGCEYRPAVRCPCLRVESGTPRVNCRHCKGLGWVYPKDRRGPTVALVREREPRTQDEVAGEATTGNVTVTFPLGVVPARGDMLLPDGEEHAVQQTLRRPAVQVSAAELRSRRTVPDQRPVALKAAAERLLYPDVKRIEAVTWIDADDELREAREGVHYVLRGDLVEWVGDVGPARGAAYSVRYIAPAAYILDLGAPVFRSESGQVAPYRAMARRLDRWGSPSLRDL